MFRMCRDKMNTNPELILGCAEFNPEGYAGKPRPSSKEIVRILNLAWEAGIRTLDTAEAYNCQDVIQQWGSMFKIIDKTKNVNVINKFYHYGEEEKAIWRKQASIYTQEQFLYTTEEAIVPFSIYRTEFKPGGIKTYARSVFERGRLLKMGYTVKDCLSFVKRHPFTGVIVGVCKEKELQQILEAWK